jgi:hypothetical protein
VASRLRRSRGPACGPYFPTAAGAGFFLDAGGAAAQGAKVVEAGAADLALAHDFDFVDAGGVAQEGALYADAVADFADREGGGGAGAADADDVAFEDLDTLAVALNDLGADADVIAGGEIGDVWVLRGIGIRGGVH